MAAIAEILSTMDYGAAPESEAAVRAWLNAHGATFGHFIAGSFVPSAGGSTFETRNPARDEPLATVAEGTPADIDRAVAAARAAFSDWRGRPGHERGRFLYALARHIQKRERFLAVLEALDTGKPIRESRDIDVPLAARHFSHHAGWAAAFDSEFPGHHPLGVCGQIIPWNFPLLMLAWKIAPALAAGNTVVLKPAEYTPLTALAFAEICTEIGLPPGVVNVVTGDGVTGEALVAHPDVDKIAFTGSTDVGRLIQRATAGSGKKLSLELGGKSPFIVHDDADLDAAVEGVVDAIWFNGGQVCCAGSRILVQEAVSARFLDKLKARMATLRVGDPLDKGVDMGAIVAPAQLDRIRELVRQGEAEGVALHQPACELPDRGCYHPPSLFLDTPTSSTVAEVEIFGPVAVAMTFRTPDEAVQLANHTRYGLAASVWSETPGLAWDTANRVKAGVVWINCTNIFDAAAPFGGYKESGFGREGGRAGLLEYLRANEDGRRGAIAVVPDRALLSAGPGPAAMVAPAAIDRTAKLYIGGRQVRADGGASATVPGPDGRGLGQIALGGRKDIRNAVEAATKTLGWGALSGHARAQVLFYLAENLAARRDAFAERLAAAGATEQAATAEVEAAVRRVFFYAGMADKHDGRVVSAKARHLTLALHEPYGVVGVVCPAAAPLLGFVSSVLPLIAVGNGVIAIPGPVQPLVATDFYQLLDTSDVPPGVVNIVTGEERELAATLAAHDEVAALWHFGSVPSAADCEALSAGNLKAVWSFDGAAVDWRSDAAQGAEFLRRAVQVKTVWMPYGA